MTAIERLEALLNEKDALIEELEERAQKAEEKAEANHVWTRHRIYENPSDAPGAALPVPRLEMRWQNATDTAGGYEIEAAYSLVYRHLLGHVVFVPLGLTRSTGALVKRVCEGGEVDLPFRDGAHFRNEMRQLRLPAFGIVGEHVWEFKPCPRCGRLAGRNHPEAAFATCALPPLESGAPASKEGGRHE